MQLAFNPKSDLSWGRYLEEKYKRVCRILPKGEKYELTGYFFRKKKQTSWGKGSRTG
jgi:hypothetical protein